MKRVVRIVAGPFPSKIDALRWAIRQHNIWPSTHDVRKYRRGWYILDRNPDTHHVGNKRDRKRWQRIAIEQGFGA